MKSTRIILGVLVGAAVGAALGVLFAPDKGAKTRDKLLAKGTNYSDSLKEQFNELVDTIINKAADAKEDANSLAANGIAKLHDAKKEIKQATS